MDSSLWLLRGQCSKGLITKDKEKLGEEQVKKKKQAQLSHLTIVVINIVKDCVNAKGLSLQREYVSRTEKVSMTSCGRNGGNIERESNDSSYK